jgi:hypothetical protein
LFFPSAAARTIRARNAICYGVLWRRTSSSSACRSASDSSTVGGLRPRIGHSFPLLRGERDTMTQLYHSSIYAGLY